MIENYTEGFYQDWMALMKRAWNFADAAHSGVRRKHGNNEPYVRHVERVARSVAQNGGDPNMVVAALLHDTIEDTAVTYEIILENFGPDVALLVLELTDRYTKEAFPSQNRHLRKAQECERLRTISDRAKFIKRWDIADNTRDIVARDPGFAPIYLREKAAVLEAIGYSQVQD